LIYTLNKTLLLYFSLSASCAHYRYMVRSHWRSERFPFCAFGCRLDYSKTSERILRTFCGEVGHGWRRGWQYWYWLQILLAILILLWMDSLALTWQLSIVATSLVASTKLPGTYR